EGHESANPQSPIPTPQSLATSHQPLATNLSPLSPLPSPLFAVRTPTAIVTDLGTEFGVEVAINGDTTSHVFEGTVVIQAGIRGVGDAGMRDSDQRPATAVAGSKSDQSVALVAGQSVRVGRVCETHQEPATSAVVRFTQPTEPPQFARRLREPPKFIDLLDIVAGGDGTNGRRGRGISPADGRIMHEYVDARCLWIGQYNPVYAYRMIDGVFMPNGSNGQVQLDSAGHKFDGFPETLGRSWGSIWARAAKNESEQNVEEGWIYSITDLEDFTPDSRGLLAFCPNVGLTFDLEEVRKRYPEARLKGFHAVAGLASSSLSPPMADGRADLWIFVDGHLKYKRIGLARKDGPVEIDIELTDADHFLTLVSTDGGDGIIADWLVFGDPVLRISDAIE
ncbi:MAG: hypothetical protein GX594_15025, partial [Pirellulaceae bacterium]|nr:hypothetical protein [Pirellulaceae bacterium]